MLFEDKSLEVIKETIRKERAEGEIERENANEMLIDFYCGNQLGREYLAAYGFEDEKGNTDLPMVAVNLTKKIINKISLAYKYQPERMVADSEDNSIGEWFAFNEEFAMGYKYAERYKNLLSKVLHRAHFNPERKRWYPYIETMYEAHFLDEDPLHPYAFSYPYKQIIKSNIASNDVWWMFWSDDYVFSYLPGTDKIRYDETFAPDGTNPFGIMPMVEMRTDFPVDAYESVGAFDLIRANQNVNIALNNLNTMVYFQAHDQVVIGGIGADEIKRIRLGTADPIVASSADVNFDLLGFNPKITESVEAIKFNIQSIAYSYNLAINWALEYNAASGFSLLVQNIDLAEAREDDVELMTMHEKKMYKVLSSMQEYYKRFNMIDSQEPALPKEAMLSVDFEESMRLPINQTEEMALKDWKIAHNVITEIDLIKQENPDMDDIQATEKYQENKKINGTLSAADQIREGLENEGVIIEPTTE